VRYEQLTRYAFPAKIQDLQSTAGLCGRLENGEVYCVGFDPEGSFGLPEAPNDTVLTATKLEIPPAVGFAYGFAASCALDADGILRCSGRNHGILGLDPSQVPSRRGFDVVPGLPRVDRIKVSDAGDRACASVGGDLYCWGANDWGCIQPDGPDDVYTPTLMEPFHDIVDFTPSEAICVIRANGSVWCHGDAEQNGACGMPGDGQWAQVKFEGCDAF
jgi:hypothetical protein